MTSPNTIDSKSWAMVLALGLTWGTTFLVIELALPGIGPTWLACGRLIFAAVLMIAVQSARRAPLFLDPDAPRPWVLIIIVGLLSTALPFNLLTWGQQYVTSGFAGISMAIVALIVLPLAHFLVPGERITLSKTAGFTVGFIGVFILIGSQSFDSTGAELEPLGRAACLGAATCYAISSVLVRRLPPVDPVNLAGVFLYIGALVALPLAFFQEGLPTTVSLHTLGWVALLGLIPTAAANVLRVIVIRRAGPTFMSIVNYIVPVCSVFAGWLILSEPLPPSLLWALALILGGVALSQFRTLLSPSKYLDKY